MEAAVCDYFTRLTGARVGPETPISLTSVQIGAASAWLRRQGVSVSERELVAQRFSVASLLRVERQAARPEAPSSSEAAEGGRAGMPSIGIDIEQISSLPDAPDFRDHEFYNANFTDAEIAYCIGRGDPRQSFCGLWAAKEAVRKAAESAGLGTSLIDIEIGHDEAGCPTHPQFALSISHAGDLCVALAASPPAAALSLPGELTTGRPDAAGATTACQPASDRSWKLLSLASMLMAVAALGFSLR